MSEQVDAILPAGGRIDGAFADETGTEIKALIRFDGRTLLERAIRAIRESGRVSRIVVVGPEELRRSSVEADALIPDSGSGPENHRRGLEWLRPSTERVLILTTDLPFVRPESITAFIDSCPPDIDICLPVLRREAFESEYPGSPATWVRLRDGEWTLASAALITPVALDSQCAHIDRVFALRKSNLALARLLGPAFILRYLTRGLRIEDVEEKCRQIVGCSGAAVPDCPPDLAFDIDLPEEYRYALSYLAGEISASHS